jgi:HEPN domain-containing protein
MPHDSLPAPGSAAQWLWYAQGDLVLARTQAFNNLPIDLLIFHAEQVVEKSIKAVLVHFNAQVPRTHNLELLMDEAAAYVEIPLDIRAAEDLTPYATGARYPGDYEPNSDDAYQDALAKAEKTLSWAKSICLQKE